MIDDSSQVPTIFSGYAVSDDIFFTFDSIETIIRDITVHELIPICLFFAKASINSMNLKKANSLEIDFPQGFWDNIFAFSREIDNESLKYDNFEMIEQMNSKIKRYYE